MGESSEMTPDIATTIDIVIMRLLITRVFYRLIFVVQSVNRLGQEVRRI